MKTKIKFCGICSEQDIDYVNITKPDYIGFVFVNSRWQISYEKALELRNRLEKGIIPVGIFKDENVEDILSLYENGIVDMATFFGGKAHKLPCKTITLWPDTSGDYVTFDKAKDGVGGTGERLDWNKLPKTDKPFFLAGGLSYTNVKEAIEIAKPYAVDVISGIETDGKKDLFKMKKFIERVREYE